MATLISVPQWNNFRGLIKSMHDTVNLDQIIWVRGKRTVQMFQEQEFESGDRVVLNAHVSYNTFRTWPITKKTNAGEIDNQNQLMWLNRDYLFENGWLNPQGHLDFNPDLDYFIHMGIRYKCEGYTPASSAYGGALFVILVMLRQEVTAGVDPMNYPTTQNARPEIETDNIFIYSQL